MAKSVNSVTLLGNLGQDPEVKALSSGAHVANFSLATTESFKDQSGNWQDKTEWHRVVFWNRQAEIAGQYLHKGDKVYVEGKLQTRSWDQDGVTRYITEVRGTNLVLLSNKGDNSGGGGFNPAPQQAPYNDSFQEAKPNNNPAQNSPADQFDDDDDDVPF